MRLGELFRRWESVSALLTTTTTHIFFYMFLQRSDLAKVKDLVFLIVPFERLRLYHPISVVDIEGI